jgi:hypothetical protein
MENINTKILIGKINSFNNVKYNEIDKIVDVIDQNKTKEIDQFFLKGPMNLVRFLEEQKFDFSLIFKKIKIKELNLAYYANCLHEHIYQILDENISHSQTCWSAKCEKTIELGRIYKDSTHKDIQSIIKNGCEKKKINSNNIQINNPDLIVVDQWLKFIDKNKKFNNGFFQKLKIIIKRIIFKNNFDRSIKLVNKIKKEGFDIKKFYANENALNVIAGYSAKTKNYMIFHGKHRIAAIKYLQHKGEIDKELELAIPILRYNFNHVRQSAPGLECFRCKN